MPLALADPAPKTNAPPERAAPSPTPDPPGPALSITTLLDSGPDLLTLAKATNLPLPDVVAWFKSQDIQKQLRDLQDAQAQCAELQSTLNVRLKQSALETLGEIHTDPETPQIERRRAATTILRALRTPITHARQTAGDGESSEAGAAQRRDPPSCPPSYPYVPKPGFMNKRSLSPLVPLTPLDTDVPPPPIPDSGAIIASLRDAVGRDNLAQLPGAADHESDPSSNPAALDAFLAHFVPEADYEDPAAHGPDDTLRACKLPERAEDLPPALASKLTRDFVGIVQTIVYDDPEHRTDEGVEKTTTRVTFVHPARCTVATLHAQRIDQQPDQASAGGSSPDWRLTKLTIEHRTGKEDTS